MDRARAAVAASLCVSASVSTMASEVDAGGIASGIEGSGQRTAYSLVLDLQHVDVAAAPRTPSIVLSDPDAGIGPAAAEAPAGPSGESCPHVPLPGTLPLLAAGLAAMGAWARRPRR